MFSRWAVLAAALLLGACATVAPPPAAVVPAPVAALPETSPAPVLAEAPPATQALPADPRVGDAWRTRERLALEEQIARTDLWARVRSGFAAPDLDDEFVRKWERYYATRPDYVARMMERGGRYLFHIVEEVSARGMPMELALLPFIESAFNPQAMSTARAAGMWQFIPSTGRDFDLKQNLFRDDRRDVIASTRAALDYLQQLHGMFGDWHLALAAYNWGQGSVQRALKRNQGLGQPLQYSALRMPDETRNYVPKLQAIKNIVQRPEAFGLALPALENHPFFLAVGIERDIDVALAARLAGLTLDSFQQFNPQMNRPVILAAGTPQVLLPYDNANQFLRALTEHRGPLASWTAWVAPRTLKPADAAKLVGMNEADLREVNRIPPRMLVKQGSTLLVPRAAHSLQDVSLHLADNAAMLLAPDGPRLKRVVLKAGKKGDSVASVAKRYRLPAADVARWNDVGVQARFKAGSAIVVMLPQKAASKRTRTASGGTPARKPATRAARSPR
ncbi:MAG: transglycosylase SLT domain-containing protein [Rubrivivax sp.]|nr:transglycosylase SLT domain-containing protein [Rubrivivax sp.]